jgi:hypothetical protein
VSCCPRGNAGRIPQGLQPGKALENSMPYKNKGGRPAGSVNRYTGALKELFLQAAEKRRRRDFWQRRV